MSGGKHACRKPRELPCSLSQAPLRPAPGNARRAFQAPAPPFPQRVCRLSTATVISFSYLLLARLDPVFFWGEGKLGVEGKKFQKGKFSPSWETALYILAPSNLIRARLSGKQLPAPESVAAGHVPDKVVVTAKVLSGWWWREEALPLEMGNTWSGLPSPRVTTENVSWARQPGAGLVSVQELKGAASPAPAHPSSDLTIFLQKLGIHIFKWNHIYFYFKYYQFIPKWFKYYEV